MSCRSCRPISSARPSEEELAKYAKPCDCGLHDWVEVPTEKGKELACRKCRVVKRGFQQGKNAPCPGKPPWSDLKA